MRRAALLLSAVLVTAVAWPALRSPDDDSFPLSTYPMFARSRPPQAWFSTAVAVDADGAPRRLTTRSIGGTAEPVHAAVTVQRAIADGSAARLCEEVAGRVAGAVPAVEAIEVVSLLIDLDDWYRGDERPRQRTVHARCAVPAAPRR
jgi:hypothetical protein